MRSISNSVDENVDNLTVNSTATVPGVSFTNPGGTTLNYCEDVSAAFNWSYSGASAAAGNVSCIASRIGNRVVLKLPTVSVAASAVASVFNLGGTTPLPARFRPGQDLYMHMAGESGGGIIDSLIIITATGTGTLYGGVAGGNFATGATTNGWRTAYITYLVV